MQKSAGEIAAKLGTTRNAVIGKVDRLGLKLARQPGFRKMPEERAS